MKRTAALAGLLLLPLLAFAYELEPEYVEFAKELNGTLETTVQETADGYETDITNNKTDKTPLEQIKAILRNCKAEFMDSHSCKGEVLPPYASPWILRYFNTNILAKQLEEQQLDSILKNDEELLNEIANYIVKTRPNRNDFETLLTVGVNPIEAAIRTNKEDYITSALQKGYIVYDHYYIEHVYDEYCSRRIPLTSREIIPVRTSQEEINEIIAKLEKQNRWEPPQWLRKIINKIEKDYNKIQEAYKGTEYRHW